MSNEELLKIRNFGEKSLEELLTKLKGQDMLDEQEHASRSAGRDDSEQPEEREVTLQVAEVEDLLESSHGRPRAMVDKEDLDLLEDEEDEDEDLLLAEDEEEEQD
jgi:hypothetical protein